MYDYYLPVVMDAPPANHKWDSVEVHVLNLGMNESFTVKEEKERVKALMIGRRNNIRLVSRKLGPNGFQIWRVQMGPPRKRGYKGGRKVNNDDSRMSSVQSAGAN